MTIHDITQKSCDKSVSRGGSSECTLRLHVESNYMFRFEIFCIDGEGGSDGLVEFPGGSLSL